MVVSTPVISYRNSPPLGYGATPLGRFGKSASALMQSALEKALSSSGLLLKDLDGLELCP